MIFGHSHQQFKRKKEEFNLINTGSLGQNRSNINQSCYIKLNTETNEIELKFFIHDIDKVINQMKRIFDIILSLLFIIIFSWLLLFVYIL